LKFPCLCCRIQTIISSILDVEPQILTSEPIPGLPHREAVSHEADDVHDLFLLERAAGGPTGSRHLEHASARGSMRVRSGDLATRRAVVVASERMDEDAGWRALESGELLHVDARLKATITRPLTEPPAHQLTLADLGVTAAASQAPAQPPA
jgi:hypothetical protein